MSTRFKTLGLAAAVTAIAVAIPTAVQAYADPGTDTTTTATTAPTSTVKVPDPQGPGCDAYKNRIPTGAGSFAGMATQKASAAIASNPDLSTFSAAISGKLNPAVNILPALDGGPYLVFAPTNDAFAKLTPAELEAFKTDPALLTKVLYYHMVLGFVGPDHVQGKMPTQQGELIDVEGKGSDIKINDTAKVVCGGITAADSAIYMIDTVLDPSDPAAPNAPTSTSSTATTTTSPAETTTSQPTTTTSAAG